MVPPEHFSPVVLTSRPRRTRPSRMAPVPGTAVHGGLLSDVDLIRRCTANVLLVGPDEGCEVALRAVWPHLLTPVVTWRRPAPLAAAVAAGASTLLLSGIDGLTSCEQEDLFDRLGEPLAPRVISTSTRPLLPLVERGDFHAALYYRLNTIYLPFEN